MITLEDIKAEGFDVDSHGYICGLGKFNGEHWAIAALWIESSDEIQYECGELYHIYFLGEDEKALFQLGQGVDVVAIHESGDGYISSRLFSDKEYQEAIDNIEEDDRYYDETYS